MISQCRESRWYLTSVQVVGKPGVGLPCDVHLRVCLKTSTAKSVCRCTDKQTMQYENPAESALRLQRITDFVPTNRASSDNFSFAKFCFSHDVQRGRQNLNPSEQTHLSPGFNKETMNPENTCSRSTRTPVFARLFALMRYKGKDLHHRPGVPIG